MILSFITNKDIEVSTKEYFLNQITAGAPHVLKTAEGAAVSLMKSMLNSRYNIVLVFPAIKEWEPTKAFLKDEFCCHNETIFKAKENTTGNNPTTADNKWEQTDPRDPLLILHCVNITLFFLCERINPRKVPEDIIDAYNRALNWLEDVKRQRENPDLPLLEIGGMELRAGSNPKLDHYY